MRINDVIQFAFHAMQGYRTRTYLMLLAMAIGVASVVLLTSLGEGARLYVTQQFSSLGTNLLIILPGRSETTGGMPPMMGETPRDLTLQDVAALQRSRYVKQLAPIVVGAAPVSYQQLEREVMIMGSTASLYSVRQLKLSRGQFLPELEITRASPECVLGHTLYKELFGNVSPLGKWVRVSEYRCRVIGVLEEEGVSLGMHMGEVLIMHAASAQTLFNVNSVFRILVEAQSQEVMEKLRQDVIKIISARHDGEDDITVLSQDALLKTFDRILTALTYSLGGIAAISLLVAGIMIMNVMLVAAAQRTTEIGLLKALGAPRKQIIMLFLTESACLSLIGAMLGLFFGLAGNWVLQHYFPDFPFQAPDWALWSAVGVALGTGLLFGLLPARHAANLDPVLALSSH
ncbi:MAG: ABC transporter permease [Gammaproteobacteria bacterium]|nr:ABC transporter permease [Gammaproteobacteria bacterium]MCK5262761.1 ABC transporter permease [Gammaproteobacteria bacterium]